MSELKEALIEAMKNTDFVPAPNVLNYIWKGPKKILPDGTITQEQFKLYDCSKTQLEGFLNHCNMMLRNTDNKNPGRYKVKEEVQQQILRCNAELFIREQISNKLTRFGFLAIVRNYLNVNNIGMNDIEHLKLQAIVSNDLYEYGNIPVEIIMDTCLDKGGLFTRKHITTTFILKQGLWLTPEEYKEHEGNIKGQSKIDVEEYFKKILGVNKKHTLKITPAGLSLTDMKESLSIKDVKYSLMGSEKLRILRDRLLFILLKDIDDHIKQWLDLIEKINVVMTYKFTKNESVNNQ